jgi:hypothetical protein
MAVEINHILRQRRPVRVVDAARKHQHDPSRPQCLRGGVSVGGDDADASKPIRQRSGEQQVMAKGVERPIVAELVIESGGEDQHVGSHHAARVIRDHKHATELRKFRQSAHF